MDSHKLYSYRCADGRYTVSIANRACVEEAIAALCRDLDIRSAAVTGIGAVDEATLRFYNPATKRYVDRRFEEQMEIASLAGNVSQMDGMCYLHLHVTLGRADYTAVAGHLLSARINGAGEIFVTPFGADTPRRYDPVTGLNIYDFQ